jgi:uncharacterized protein YeaO (DUF488 family)
VAAGAAREPGGISRLTLAQAGAVTRHALRLKRVYAPADDADGTRILVDRLWPRGLSREKGKIDLWLKDIAPSAVLRRRFHGDPAGWDAFTTAYYAELAREPAQAAPRKLLGRLRRSPVTLLFAARDETRNNAVALKAWLDAQPG